MTLSSQGFTIKNNLKESIADRTVLNNLAASPEGDDVGLLFNNKRNTSALFVDYGNVNGSVISFTSTLAVFSNHTPITIGTSTFYVKLSNGVDTFSLSTTPSLADTVATPPLDTWYVRSDEITQTNITNFSLKRRAAISGGAQSGSSSQSGGGGVTPGTTGLLTATGPKDLLLSLEANLDEYKFRTSKSLIRTSNFLGSKRLTTNGVTIIVDTDGINVATPTNSTPGLFIYNAATNSGIRAFSSNTNPWANYNDGYLKTTAVKITMGKLTISTSTGIVLQAKTGATLVSSITSTPITILNFTHKLPVTINGETYYLCLS